MYHSTLGWRVMKKKRKKSVQGSGSFWLITTSVLSGVSHTCQKKNMFRVQGAGCRVQGAGFRAQGAGCRAWGSGCRSVSMQTEKHACVQTVRWTRFEESRDTRQGYWTHIRGVPKVESPDSGVILITGVPRLRRNCPPPKDHSRALCIVLLYSPRGARLLMSEVHL